MHPREGLGRWGVFDQMVSNASAVCVRACGQEVVQSVAAGGLGGWLGGVKRIRSHSATQIRVKHMRAAPIAMSHLRREARELSQIKRHETWGCRPTLSGNLLVRRANY